MNEYLSLQIRQESRGGPELGGEERDDHRCLPGLPVVHYFPLLRSGVLVWLQTRHRHQRAHARHPDPGTRGRAIMMVFRPVTWLISFYFRSSSVSWWGPWTWARRPRVWKPSPQVAPQPKAFLTPSTEWDSQTAHWQPGKQTNKQIPATLVLFIQEPEIDCFSEEGHKLEKVKGDIKFHGVVFNYPSRPDVKVSSPRSTHLFLFWGVLKGFLCTFCTFVFVICRF